MQVKLTKKASDSSPKQEVALDAGRDEHLNIQIRDDSGNLIFDCVVWNRPVTLGVKGYNQMAVNIQGESSITIGEPAVGV